MPLGNTPILQNPLMAEGDNQKYLLFNDSLVAIEDAFNRSLAIDLSAASASLAESQLLRYMLFVCEGHTSARVLTIPVAVGSPTVSTNRFFAVRNDGTGDLTVSHSSGGQDVSIPSGETALLYADGTDIHSLGGAGGGGTMSATEIKTAYESNADTNAFTDALLAKLNGIEANATGDMTAAEIKTAYESNPDTNAFTDALLAKLTNIEANATADQTPAEIEAAYNTQVAQVSAGEIDAGGSSVRRFSPNDVKAISRTHSPYDIRTAFGSTPTDGEVFDTVYVPRDIIFADNFVGSLGGVAVNPAASFIITVADDGTTIGTISVSAAGTVSFSTSGTGEVTVAAGSALTFTAPATADTAIEGLNVTLLAHSG